MAFRAHRYLGPIIREFQRRVAEAAYGLYSLQVTSYYRDPVRNRQVNGHPYSQHQLGLAIDFVGDPVELGIYQRRALARGLVVVDENDHLHSQAFRAGTIPPSEFDAVLRLA